MSQQKSDPDTKYEQKSDSKQKGSSTKKPSGSTTTVVKPKPAEAVLTEKEMGRMIDLGLGRGIDATNEKPWVSKSSFQVRRVAFDSVIGTEEGGALQSYEREISSVQSQQTSLKASIAVPQSPFTIGVDAEHSRSVSTTRRAVGKKVINRTISFRADFEDVPLSSVTDPTAAKLAAIPTYSVSVEESNWTVTDSQSRLTFEERLAKWILERLHHKREVELTEEGKLADDPKHEITGNPLDDLASLIHHSTSHERKQILAACREFVKYFRLTHYVSSIQLGASEYRVLSETEYFSRVKTGGTFGVESLANLAISSSTSWKKTKKASDLKRIGRISHDLVERGSYDEAVVGVSIQPISNLVRIRYLQLALRKAMLEFVDAQGDSSAGPYIVACANDKIFWTVDTEDDCAVRATRDIRNASAFYVFPNDDGGHPYEFTIGYYGDSRKVLTRTKSMLTSTPTSDVAPIPRYLHCPVGIFGQNAGPLHLKNHVLDSQSRLTLQSRLVKKYTPVDIGPWVNGSNVFFINCSRRKGKLDGYICVKSVTRGGTTELRTACVYSKHNHNERDSWMLFRLLPISLRDTTPSVPAKSKQVEPDVLSDVDVELDKYGVLDEAPKPRKKSSGATVHFEDARDTTELLLSSAGKRLDTSAETFPLPGASVDLPELTDHQSPDLTKAGYSNSTV